MLRKISSTALVVLLTLICHSQDNSYFNTENNLVDLYNKVHKCWEEHCDSDSLTSISEEFGKILKSFISYNPATIDYSFDSLSKNNSIHIITSDDGIFRIYSWDKLTGGTMHFYDKIYQFKTPKSKDETLSRYITEDEADGMFNNSYCSEIYIVDINNVTHYLAISNGVYSSRDLSQSISVFSIRDSELVDTIKLFKTNRGLLNTISVEFDFFSVMDRPERPLRLITFDDKKKIVYIPVVDDKGKVIRRRIKYKLKGDYFVCDGVTKSYK